MHQGVQDDGWDLGNILAHKLVVSYENQQDIPTEKPRVSNDWEAAKPDPDCPPVLLCEQERSLYVVLATDNEIFWHLLSEFILKPYH